jgi:hypothetical protein
LGLAVSLLGRPLQHRHAIRVRCGFWRWIVTAEQSGLLKRIAMDNASLCVRMKS